eukprot:CAMPEP_0168388700 /NCGR_PEP_ID=MMETSP0228-20121227/16586_1 /TAXON_ID=133427 /ORGANISM="Protoceratium reticulatum, Strain CCCM 535 (=CCMP 1889)" /LENGTH=195 /DNA_ID=CAMNT_0008401955 /DNA_START=70 /DNA_END=654 /DNA_ORIENTATION=-
MDSAARSLGVPSPYSAQGGQQLLEGSPTAGLSNTVCISDPHGEWPSVQAKTVKELSDIGDIARLDMSLTAVMKCILLTYFDVRCTQRVLMQLAGRTEPFPPAAHDCRVVQVHMAAFAEKVSLASSTGGFQQFGDVAHISMCGGDAIVEFYDMRAAQMLLTASAGTAFPWVAPTVPGQQSAGIAPGLGLASLLGRG